MNADLALCEEVVRRAVFVQRPDADGAAAVKEEVLHGAADDDAELGGLWPASEERPEVGLRRARAHAPFVDGHVHLPEALLLEAVVVVRAGVARLFTAPSTRAAKGRRCPAHCAIA